MFPATPRDNRATRGFDTSAWSNAVPVHCGTCPYTILGQH